jgi:hypothetical protein
MSRHKKQDRPRNRKAGKINFLAGDWDGVVLSPLNLQASNLYVWGAEGFVIMGLAAEAAWPERHRPLRLSSPIFSKPGEPGDYHLPFKSRIGLG